VGSDLATMRMTDIQLQPKRSQMAEPALFGRNFSSCIVAEH
ncbi:unnamed protein product, partial [Acidithrix sp. C25]